MQRSVLVFLPGFAVLIALCVAAVPAWGQIFVANYYPGTVGKYTTSGATINASFLAGLPIHGPTAIAVSGEDLFVANQANGTIGKYDATTGATVNSSLVTGLVNPSGIAVSGGKVFVANYSTGTIGEYDAATGVPINTSLVSGLAYPQGLRLYGDNLYVMNANAGNDADRGTIGVYTTSGATVNTSLVTGLNGPVDIAISGSNLFVTNYLTSTIGQYDTTTGAPINTSLISGLHGPEGIALYSGNLFVVNSNNGTIGEYTTSGATVNASLITIDGLSGPYGIAVVPEPSSLVLAAFGFVAFAALNWRLDASSRAIMSHG